MFESWISYTILYCMIVRVARRFKSTNIQPTNDTTRAYYQTRKIVITLMLLIHNIIMMMMVFNETLIALEIECF